MKKPCTISGTSRSHRCLRHGARDDRLLMVSVLMVVGLAGGRRRFYIGGSIAKPLGKVTGLIEAMSNGNTNVRSSWTPGVRTKSAPLKGRPASSLRTYRAEGRCRAGKGADRTEARTRRREAGQEFDHAVEGMLVR